MSHISVFGVLVFLFLSMYVFGTSPCDIKSLANHTSLWNLEIWPETKPWMRPSITENIKAHFNFPESHRLQTFQGPMISQGPKNAALPPHHSFWTPQSRWQNKYLLRRNYNSFAREVCTSLAWSLIKTERKRETNKQTVQQQQLQ